MNTYVKSRRRMSYSNTGAAILSGAVVVVQLGAFRFCGLAVTDIAATTGTGEIEVEGVHRLSALSTDVWGIGDRLFWDVTNSRLTNIRSTNVYIGRAAAAKATAATTGDVDLNAFVRLQDQVFSQVAASTAITGTAAITAFDQTYTFAANALKAGDKIRIKALVFCVSTTGAETLVVTLKLGSITIVATGAVDVANSDIAVINAEITIRTDGAGGTLVASGDWNLGTPGTATTRAFNVASTAIDTTAAQVVTVSQTCSSTGESVRLDQLSVEHIG
jgi:predicted RecA/RadA family phage recombinase